MEAGAPGAILRPVGPLGRDYHYGMAAGSVVRLPKAAREPFEVYINGVLQREGVDYVVEGRLLRFPAKELAYEGKLGTVRWASMLLGVAGTYRKNDTVDVVYEVDGKKTVATGLALIPPDES